MHYGNNKFQRTTGETNPSSRVAFVFDKSTGLVTDRKSVV